MVKKERQSIKEEREERRTRSLKECSKEEPGNVSKEEQKKSCLQIVCQEKKKTSVRKLFSSLTLPYFAGLSLLESAAQLLPCLIVLPIAQKAPNQEQQSANCTNADRRKKRKETNWEREAKNDHNQNSLLSKHWPRGSKRHLSKGKALPKIEERREKRESAFLTFRHSSSPSFYPLSLDSVGFSTFSTPCP